ncbi:putative E3 ubiquitin-protein ligase SINA-like 6 [Miscanthus floridulus]|uniref:putative E3 ubiquitin-protein ligase SINA-like 6 n=1 Tax=Miscanthus floridulus TaxID=154761 RepID=UPI003459C654
MNLDAFECPICLSVFQGSIFQCKNGHVVCDACRVHIQGSCPSCREPVGEIRCRALEDAIAGVVVPCAFCSHGCRQLFKLKEMRDHEAFHCQQAPFACPLPACAYSAASAPLLHDNILDAHALDRDRSFSLVGSTWWVSLRRSMPFMVLLDRVERRVFLLLNGGDVRSGRSLSVVCLGPRPAANKSLELKLEVGVAGEPGALSMSATGSVACMRSWAGQYPTDGFLFVPDAYYSLDRVVVKVHVDHAHALDRLASFVRRYHDAVKPLDLLLLVLLLVFFAMAVNVRRALDNYKTRMQ